jgi:U3 small nucleolar RNA-associated protein 22
VQQRLHVLTSLQAKSGVTLIDKECLIARPIPVAPLQKNSALRDNPRPKTTHATMAPPAVKRRKLEQDDDESEGSFADFGADAPSDHDSAAESDVDMEASLDDEAVSDSDDDEGDEEHEKEAATKTSANTAAAPPKPAATKRPAASLQDGAYTAETFKSNMFKLQVDELLEQVKPKHGTKAATADNAMRTLKTIIEQIPARDALSVRTTPRCGSALLTVYPDPRS